MSEFSIQHLSEEQRLRLLSRYEWLAEFVMHAPDCAPIEKQQELWRRIQMLRRSSGLEAISENPPVSHTEQPNWVNR